MDELRELAHLLQAFELVTSKESQAKFGYQIVRYKNKFHSDSTDTFKNIMVNAMVRGVRSLQRPGRGAGGRAPTDDARVPGAQEDPAQVLQTAA